MVPPSKHVTREHGESGPHTPQEEAEASQLPGLYEVYKAEFGGMAGRGQAGTLMIDNGSDTNFVRHEFALSLGLQGEPHRCRLKVVGYRLPAGGDGEVPHDCCGQGTGKSTKS